MTPANRPAKVHHPDLEAPIPDQPLPIFDLAPADARLAVTALVRELGLPEFRTSQILPWLWQRPVRQWAEATDLPRSLQEVLQARAPGPGLTLAERQRSSDGTVKSLWRLGGGLFVESVWIPERQRVTLCISSQAGCAYGCVFCATGRMGFQRHLAPSEIAGQVREMALDPEFGVPNNVVFMGMGEPLHNWPAVDTALSILNDPAGFGLGARRITVSTIGIIPALRKFAARPEQFRLAISLHAATSARRAALMPIERKYPLEALLAELGRFRKRITFEYVMIRGRNDGEADAVALAEIARRFGAMVNLLPLHPGGGSDLVPAGPQTIEWFARRLRELGANATIRRSRGLDISAACGQLRVEAAGVG